MMMTGPRRSRLVLGTCACAALMFMVNQFFMKSATLQSQSLNKSPKKLRKQTDVERVSLTTKLLDESLENKLYAINKSAAIQDKHVDRFYQLPDAAEKVYCERDFYPKDTRLSVVLYLRNAMDSIPLQTLYSVEQFSRLSGISLAEVVIVHKNIPSALPAHEEVIAYMKNVMSSQITFYTSSADTEWAAKKAGVELTTSQQVLVIDDSILPLRNFIKPLVEEVDSKPMSIVIPHMDSIMPGAIYSNDDGQQVFHETTLGYFTLNHQLRMTREELSHIVSHAVAELTNTPSMTGEVFLARRSNLLKIMNLMKTDNAAELSLLTWLCGEGIRVLKCSTVARSFGYYLEAVRRRQMDLIELYYPESLISTNSSMTVNDEALHAQEERKHAMCKTLSWYFQTVMQIE